MKIHIITIFPESFKSYFDSSIMWKAKEKGLFEIELYKLNDFSDKKFRHVDDNAYGMHWQVISPEPISKAIDFIFENIWKKLRVLYLTPSWNLLNQEKIEKYYDSLDEFIIICGHYEWIDERIIELYWVEKISIWEYVISSWELAASVFIDSLIRHIPCVLWNKQSLEEDSFSEKFDRQKEYPVYTRPEKFMWKKVPEILLSGNHLKIEKWKQKNLTK
jgi:tRNA (guanine37-N1)-methyltransferase